MKRDQYRKRLLIVCLFTAAAIIFAVISGGGLSVTKGRCIKTENDTYFVVKDSTPVQMKNTTNHKAPFRNYSTGDSILIIHGPVAESLPAQTAVHWALKLSGGSSADVPREAINTLAAMGWVVTEE